VAERSNAAVSKTVSGGFVRRGFKSLPLRLLKPKPSPLRGFSASTCSENRPVGLPPETAKRPLETGAHWRATGAHLARESEITPSSPKVRRELFEIVLQEQILFAAR
jgi:hypothetical protein